MTGKRVRGSASAGTVPKKARKAISLQTKLDILRRFDAGDRLSDIAKSMNLSVSTVGTIKKEKEKILASARSTTPATAKLLTKHRPSIMEEMERLLAIWVDDMHQRKDSPMTNLALQEKALSLFEDLQQSQGGSNDQPGTSTDTPAPAVTFTASRGWLDRFKKRQNLHSIKMSGEAASADKEAAAAYLPVIKQIIEDGGYTPHQVFNVDETGLYWKRMPAKTVLSREEKSAPGHKPSKDRVTLILGGNAQGDMKLKPMLIHTAENPRALKGFVKSSLPVIWRANKKAWTTRPIFQEWFTNAFLPAVERYCLQKNISHKVLLLLDNAPSHPVNLSDISEKVRVDFLPKNTTSLIQPMDQGVIATFKAYYLRRTFRQMIRAVDSDINLTIREFWKRYNIKDAIDNIAESWKEVTEANMNGVWRKLWPDCVNEFRGFPSTQTVVREIVGLAHDVGFNDVDEDDINELLGSHDEELTNEDLIVMEQDRAAEEQEQEPERILTQKLLSEALSNIDAYVQKLVDNDPNRERSLMIEQGIESLLMPYRELYREKQLRAKQTRVTSFFRPSPAQPPAPQPASEQDNDPIFVEEAPPTLPSDDDVDSPTPVADPLACSSTDDDEGEAEIHSAPSPTTQ